MLVLLMALLAVLVLLASGVTVAYVTRRSILPQKLGRRYRLLQATDGRWHGEVEDVAVVLMRPAFDDLACIWCVPTESGHLIDSAPFDSTDQADEVLTRIISLARAADGITLTPDERAMATEEASRLLDSDHPEDRLLALRVLQDLPAPATAFQLRALAGGPLVAEGIRAEADLALQRLTEETGRLALTEPEADGSLSIQSTGGALSVDD